jgi:hypothetical protein
MPAPPCVKHLPGWTLCVQDFDELMDGSPGMAADGSEIHGWRGDHANGHVELMARHRRGYRKASTRYLLPTSALCPFTPKTGATGCPKKARGRFTVVGMTWQFLLSLKFPESAWLNKHPRGSSLAVAPRCGTPTALGMTAGERIADIDVIARHRRDRRVKS